MADRTSPQSVDVKQTHPLFGGVILDLDVAASTTIYKGTFVEMDAGFDLVDAGTGSTGNVTGLVIDGADNSSGSDGDLTARILVGGIIVYALTSTQTDIGKSVYASDNQTLTLTAANNPRVGVMLEITGDANIAIIQMQMDEVNAAALTAAIATITHTAPGTDDFAWADVTTSTPYGLANQDEARSVLKAIRINQLRISEIAAALVARGIIDT